MYNQKTGQRRVAVESGAFAVTESMTRVTAESMRVG